MNQYKRRKKIQFCFDFKTNTFKKIVLKIWNLFNSTSVTRRKKKERKRINAEKSCTFWKKRKSAKILTKRNIKEYKIQFGFNVKMYFFEIWF